MIRCLLFLKHTILICGLIFYSICIKAQSSDSVSVSDSNQVHNKKASKKSTFVSVYYGMSNYLGDLGGNSGVGKGFIFDNNLKRRTTFTGVSFSFIQKEAIGLRLGFTSGNLSGGDQDIAFKNVSDDAYYRFKRNLDFQTKIKEWSLLFEVYPFKFINTKRKLHHWDVQPYLLGGVGRFKFNPQGSYYDEISADYVWVDLYPLQTEGQGMKEYPNRKPYKLSQWNLPYGVGVQYTVGAKSIIGIEFVGRKLFTDYLDDVSTTFINPNIYSTYLYGDDADIARSVNNKSNLIDPNHPYKEGDQRGNPKSNDFYYSFNIKLSIQLNKRKDRVYTPKVPPHKTESRKADKNAWYKYDNNEICN